MFKSTITAALCAMVLCSAPAFGAEEQPNPATSAANWTNLLVAPVAKAQVFESLDKKRFLCYEIILTNFSSKTLKIRGMDIRDGDDPLVVIKPVEDKELRGAVVQLNRTSDVLTFGPGSVGVCFINIELSPTDPVPASLTHLIVYDQNAPGAKSVFVEVRHGRVEVDTTAPVVLGPPLKGGPWLVCGGYNNATGHRRSIIPIDNKPRVAQRYAIDWVKLDKNSRTQTKVRGGVEASTCYGEPVIAVADAQVVGVVDRFPDQPIQKASGDAKFPGGNSVTLKLPNGQFAFYAHLKPGSIKVKEGETVKKGQELGLVGNSGNSTGPHLHMQITDGPATLGSNGVPYYFEQFKVTGKIADMKNFDKVDAAAAPHKVVAVGENTVKNVLPGDGTVLFFE